MSDYTWTGEVECLNISVTDFAGYAEDIIDFISGGDAYEWDTCPDWCDFADADSDRIADVMEELQKTGNNVMSVEGTGDFEELCATGVVFAGIFEALKNINSELEYKVKMDASHDSGENEFGFVRMNTATSKLSTTWRADPYGGEIHCMQEDDCPFYEEEPDDSWSIKCMEECPYYNREIRYADIESENQLPDCVCPINGSKVFPREEFVDYYIDK